MMIKDTYYLYGNTPIANHFFIVGRDYDDCLKQLQEYGAQHIEKWIYFYDCGMHSGKPVPTAEQHFEVCVYDKKPAELMMFYILFQEGNTHEEEQMTPDMRKKQLKFFYMLGSRYQRRKK